MDTRTAQEVARPPSIFFKDRGNDSYSTEPSSKPSLLTRGLPQFLHLLTAQQWPMEVDALSSNQLLVRLQHVGTPEVGPITVDLSDTFTLGRITKVTEMSLTANQLVEEAKRNSLSWPSNHDWKMSRRANDNSTLVVIQPEEVRTLILDVVRS